MKYPWEWNEADLLNLIKNGVKESIELDYGNATRWRKQTAKRMRSARTFQRLPTRRAVRLCME
jgi:hypothetical protein